MSAATVLAAGRAASEALMVDTCTVTRESGHTTDSDSGIRTASTSTIYTGKCRIQQHAGVARPHEVGQALVYQLPLQLQLPMSSAGFAVGDVVTLTSSANDPDLVDRKWWVRELAHKTDATARRLGIEEVTS